MCIVASFIVTKTTGKIRCCQPVNVKLWHIHTAEYYTINYWYIHLFEWFSRELCWVKKKANSERLDTVHFHLYGILEMPKIIEMETS